MEGMCVFVEDSLLYQSLADGLVISKGFMRYGT